MFFSKARRIKALKEHIEELKAQMVLLENCQKANVNLISSLKEEIKAHSDLNQIVRSQRDMWENQATIASNSIAYLNLQNKLMSDVINRTHEPPTELSLYLNSLLEKNNAT